jgi:16S rRNA (cytidine1402-2'-O)-methyltransferase
VSLDTTAPSTVIALQQAAAQATAGQHLPPGTLYVVATPIGNLADLTLRAVHLLGLVDAVACEDTRVSATLLQRLGLHRPLLSLHEHNEEAAARGVVERLHAGQRIAYLSDAGTPAVSDPGARLVAAVQAAGLRVMPLPGASSVVTALSAAGDAHGLGFRFEGFLPTQAGARRRRLDELAGERASVVIFEAPHRVEALAEALAEALPTRRLTVCRELTKQFEQILPLDAAAFPAWLAERAEHRRGEFVLVLHGVAAGAAGGGGAAGDAPVSAQRLLQTLLAELPLKQAVALAARATGLPRNTLYEQALAWRDAAAGLPEDDADDADGEVATRNPATEPSDPRQSLSPAVLEAPADPRRVALARSSPPPTRGGRRRR